ncbi:hypothetical protein OG948_50350 (plasmid) [Embleya sp. NBC_00888]|uniref:hypothetical protein n=1 Tax=Embleya sp. NBC_00888 TaxID=2975960 RepID=UPI002F90C854|nr:hypothetical protein OG948_50350 [Embleya sp. NBC_00888]
MNDPAEAKIPGDNDKGITMTRLRTTLVSVSAAAFLAIPATLLTAPIAAAGPGLAAEGPGCAQLGDHGPGWANINNDCSHGINASVEVDGYDPDCIAIPAKESRRVTFAADAAAYYAYEC